MLNEEKRGIEEAYTSASNTSDMTLRHTDLPPGDADILIASGLVMNQNRLGMALRRLHSDIDSRGRPRPMDGQDLERLAATLPKVIVGSKKTKAGELAPKMGLDVHRATQIANELYARAFERFLGQLKEFPVVKVHLTAHVLKWAIPDAEHKAAAVLMWHMQQKCSACGGTKLRTALGTNRHTAQICRTCWGGGEREIPCGHDGRRIANFLDDCSSRGLQTIRARLRG